MNVRLINRHALSCQARSIVNGDIMQLGMLIPIFIQNEQQLLRSSHSEHRQQNMTTPSNDGMHIRHKHCLLLRSSFKTLNAIRAFDDEDVGSDRWYFCFDEMAIFFARVVASVEDFETRDVDEVHACAEDVACVIGDKRHTGARRDLLVSGNGDDIWEGEGQFQS